MSQKRIEHTTSRTAEWMCMCRAISSLESNPCYRSADWVARSLLPGFFRLLIRIPFAGRLFIKAFATKGSYEYVIARTKYIDAAFSQALSDQFAQILLFGAGFDTRALRLQGEARQTRIFELDAPATQQAKINQYRRRHLNIPSNLVFVPIDFDRESLTMKLDQAGFKRDARSLFILEGVLMYLQPQSVDQTFRTIRELAGAGSEVVFDYIYASVLRHRERRDWAVCLKVRFGAPRSPGCPRAGEVVFHRPGRQNRRAGQWHALPGESRLDQGRSLTVDKVLILLS
jgi:methyltransferase (TIGR00027 family)